MFYTFFNINLKNKSIINNYIYLNLLFKYNLFDSLL